MNDATPQIKTLRDLALNTVPAALREPLLTLAAQYYITTPDDPFWTIASATANAMAAAQAAGEAAISVQTAVQEIPGAIYEGASKAAADVKTTIETSIVGTVNASVQAAAQAGADALRKAAADLPAVAHTEQGRIVQEWRAALADAARKNAFAGFLQRLSVNVVVLAILIIGIFASGLVSGGAGIEVIMRAQHRLVPAGWALEVGTDGKPLCGPFAGHQVCLAHKAPQSN
ncbi:MAG: hypothetical protein ACYCR3_08060 [Acidithiobacillus sp.]